MPFDRVLVIASGVGAVARLARPLARTGVPVHAWSPAGSRLASSRDLASHRELADGPVARREQLAAIASGVTPQDWVILGSDLDLHAVWDASRDNPAVAELLPLALRRDAVSGKVAMAGILDGLAVRQPRWAVSPDHGGLAAAVAAVGGDAMVKADRGWGGMAVWRCRVAADAPAGEPGPFLVQERIDGDPVSIDVVVVRGEVAIAPYSLARSLTRPLGTTLRRRYVALEDDALREDLGRIARGLGGSWLGNLSAIRRPDGTHAIIEVDPRPNAWHAYLDRLGYPLQEALRAAVAGGALPAYAEPAGIEVANLTRVVQQVVRGDRSAGRDLLDVRATWALANRGDARLTYVESRHLAHWALLALTQRAAGGSPDRLADDVASRRRPTPR